MRIDWRAALTFVTREPAWRVRVGVGGVLMLVLPPVGWLLALGYRSVVGNRLVDGRAPILPPWRGNLGLFFRRGAASLGVILGYLAPFFVGYWLLGVRTAAAPFEHWRELGAFAAAVIVLPPVAIPALPVLYGLRYDWLQFSAAEIALLIVLSIGVILFLPAAFLQVARHRRFRAAFNVIAAVRVIAGAPRLYLEAWIVSLAVSALSVATVLLAPWMLFWSYLVITHLFLQVLGRADVLIRHEINMCGMKGAGCCVTSSSDRRARNRLQPLEASRAGAEGR